QRYHDLRNDVPVRVLSLNGQSSLDDSLGLHDSDLRISYGQTAAAVSHHRVEFAQSCDDLLDIFNGFAFDPGQFFDVLFFGRYEFVKRWIQESDGNRITLESFKESFKVRLLHRFDLCQ